MTTSASPSTNSENMTETPGSPLQLEVQSFFRRLTLKKDFATLSQSEEPGISTIASRTEAVGNSSNSPGLPKTKLSALDRLKKLGSRKGKEKASTPAFPPEEWGIDERIASNYTNATTANEGIGDNVRGVEGLAMKDLPPTPIEGFLLDENNDVSDQKAENLTLARRIQQLLAVLTSSLPTQVPWPVGPFGPSSSPEVIPSESSSTNATSRDQISTSTKEPALDTNPSLHPPPSTAGGLVQDKLLISLLSSATVMNGSLAKGKESVFSILDRLRFPSSRSASTSDALDSTEKGKVTAEASVTQEPAIEGSEDVMLYAPLEPSPDSEVEIAESEIISLSGDTGEEENVNPNGPMGSKGQEKTEKKPKEKVIWVPSPTKISVQATWWGYRMSVPCSLLNLVLD